MKKLIPVLAAAALIFAGCASDDSGSQAKPAAQSNEKNPEVGMTKNQVIALYGKTDNVRVGSDGESWIYNLNMGEQFIPFNFGYRPKLRIVEFDKDGKVKSWSYSK
ncbi:MAG TPA: hypothetical protein VK846_16955 [Candidatus Limnocylindria bacterium]|nr:hypothetical protein [Candidatus Limnocylindria bacterium]